MKNIYKLIIIGGIIGIISYTISNPHYNNYNIENNQYNSYNLLDEVIEEVKEEEVQAVIENEVVDTIKEDNITNNIPNQNIPPKEEGNNSTNIIESLIANISGYGYDCYGCTSGYTASGYYIGDGTIYYEDATYGKVRIVAADKKYAFGSIIKISNFMEESSFYAIVLDRGGAIGLDKRIQFDLLYPKNDDAKPVGIQTNVTFDILRLGF